MYVPSSSKCPILAFPAKDTNFNTLPSYFPLGEKLTLGTSNMLNRTLLKVLRVSVISRSVTLCENGLFFQDFAYLSSLNQKTGASRRLFKTETQLGFKMRSLELTDGKWVELLSAIYMCTLYTSELYVSSSCTDELRGSSMLLN